MTGQQPMERGFVGYFVRLAFGASAAFVAMLALTALVLLLAEPAGGAALAIVLVGLALAIGSMALVSKKLTARYLGDTHSADRWNTDPRAAGK